MHAHLEALGFEHARRPARRSCPSTAGIATVPGPSETVSVTSEPLPAFSPGGGSWPSTWCSGWVDVLTTVSTEKPARWSTDSAVAWSEPTTFGTTTCGVRSSRNAAITTPTTISAPSANIHQRRPGPVVLGRPAVVVAGRRVPVARRDRVLRVDARRRGRCADGRHRADHRRLRRRAGIDRGVLERRDELVGVGVARDGVLLERLQHDGLERRRDRGVVDARRHRRLADLLERDRDGAVALERHAPGEHLVEDDPDRVQVGLGADGVALGLLGREVLRRPHDRAGLRHVRRAGARDAEVRHRRAALVVDEHVVRLEVAVDDPAPVGEARGAQDLDRQVDRACRAPAAPPGG